MKIGVLAEAADGETRVAATPDTVKAYIKKGLSVVVWSGAGKGSFLSDDAYVKAGASIGADSDTLADCDVILTVRRPAAEALEGVKNGALIIGQMDPYSDQASIAGLAKRGLSLFSMELMPRISRAQSMDVLSSQANLAGYKAVIDAAARFSRAFPMMMTAAGTVAPARVFVMGAGVAGLQAIATARRLGAVISATDVRAAVAEQVQSLGAKFIFIEGPQGCRYRVGLCHGAVGGRQAKTGEARRRSYRRPGHRHNHSAHSRPPGPAAGEHGNGRKHEGRLGHRRPRGRTRRELRVVETWANG